MSSLELMPLSASKCRHGGTKMWTRGLKFYHQPPLLQPSGQRWSRQQSRNQKEFEVLLKVLANFSEPTEIICTFLSERQEAVSRFIKNLQPWRRRDQRWMMTVLLLEMDQSGPYAVESSTPLSHTPLSIRTSTFT